ncbi:MAG TPA: hypothetical protein VGI30_05255 [Caulobacteraceae bacterium]
MSLKTLEITVVQDLKAWAIAADDYAEGLVTKAWLAFKIIVLSLAPGLLTEFRGLVAKALGDIESGDLADIEAGVLNLASAELKAALQGLGSQFTQALIVIVKAL